MCKDLRLERCELGPRSGVTMIEVIIAISVLLVAVVGAYSSQLASLGLVEQSRASTVAMTDLSACMEQVMASSAELLPLPGSDFAHGGSVAAFEDLHLRDERIVVSYPGYQLNAEVPNPLQILITASWTDNRGREHQETLSSLRAR